MVLVEQAKFVMTSWSRRDVDRVGFPCLGTARDVCCNPSRRDHEVMVDRPKPPVGCSGQKQLDFPGKTR